MSNSKALSVAYAVKRKNRMAKGGEVADTATDTATDTKTQTGGSSPGGASTGGVGSGIGGAGTGGAATGGASTGGAGTLTITVSGKTKLAKNAINISNVGGQTDAGSVASGDGPGALGTGGSGKGSGGGGGGAAPSEPSDFESNENDEDTDMKRKNMANGGLVGSKEQFLSAEDMSNSPFQDQEGLSDEEMLEDAGKQVHPKMNNTIGNSLLESIMRKLRMRHMGRD